MVHIKGLVYIVNVGEKYINTYNGQDIDIDDNYAIQKIERKFGVEVMKTPMEDNIFYKYGVSTHNNVARLSILKGHYENDVLWEEVYYAEACTSHTGIAEFGDCDISFWHEYFATSCCTKDYKETNVEKFDIGNSMKQLRTVFLMELQINPFLFFEKYAKLKKYIQKEYDTSLFNIPLPRTNKVVGKVYDGRYINYVWQHEIEINGEVFFDLNIYSGNVNNGVINIDVKHRMFLTSGWWWSPDGCDLEILVRPNTYGNVFNGKMKLAHPELMLDRYNGNYPYEYMLSREYIPCFEILAKAGFGDMADIMLESWYHYYWEERSSFYGPTWENINIWGKNDKEIFGFKLSKFKNITKEAAIKRSRYNVSIDEATFPSLCDNMKKIIEKNPIALETFDTVDSEVFDFLCQSFDISNKTIKYIMNKGLCLWQTYRDYINMCKQCNRYSGGVYPDDIKHEHDVMVTYLNQLREAKNNSAFKEQVSTLEYTSLLYNGDDNDKYCILAPRVADDLVKESYSLSHCVRSYIRDVALGSTRIYFLRTKEQKAKSLVTLEVRSRYGGHYSITQARGKCNRVLTSDENNFVFKWANHMGLSPEYRC